MPIFRKSFGRMLSKLPRILSIVFPLPFYKTNHRMMSCSTLHPPTLNLSPSDAYATHGFDHTPLLNFNRAQKLASSLVTHHPSRHTSVLTRSQRNSTTQDMLSS
ncbi:hypothetical protein Hanom_Chr03g00245511 [Helianthus anomalus]